ncbi:MAG: YfhO family protein [Chloroflexi bacterium]|nr:YfhO family protein [Chloroflexota bacterium]
MNTGAHEGPTAMTDAEEWFTPGRFSLLILILILVQYPDVILGTQTFAYRDFGAFGYPLAYFHRESFWKGEIPCWNPLNNLGVPFLAQWNTLVFYPLSLFYILFPLSWSLAVFNLLHLFLAALGMYFLAFRWTNTRLGAALAGVTFAFNGLMLNCLQWPNNMAALGWMPWVILAVEKAGRGGGRHIIVAALVGAMQMLSGAPEIILFTWGVVGLQWILECWRERKATRLWRIGFVGLLVAALCAAQLLPFLDLLVYSQRHQDFSNASWAMPGWGWANFLIPAFYSYPLSHGVYFQYDQYWTSSYYVSLGALVLAVLGGLYVRGRRVGLLSAVALICLILATGNEGFVYGWLRRVVPALGLIRFPIKFVVLVVFAVPLLAAFAVKWQKDLNDSQRSTELRAGLILWLSCASLISFLIWFARAYPQYEPPFDDWNYTWRNGLVRLAFLTLILACALCFWRVQRARLRWLLQAALLVLVWFDVMTHAPNQAPTVSRFAFDPGLKYLDPLPEHGVSRAMMSPAAFQYLYEKTSSDLYTNYLCNRLGLNCNLNLLDGVAKVDGFYSLNINQTEDIRNVLYSTTGRDFSRLMDFLNVSHVTAPGKYFDWVKRESCLPMITAGQRPVFTNAIETARAMVRTNWNALETVFLPSELQSIARAINRTSAKITNPKFAAHRITFEVNASAVSMVVIAQSFYHFWRAYVDGKPVPLWRANYAFQALEVGPGRHQVELIYEDQALWWGGLISLTALAGCLFGWWKWRQKDVGQTQPVPLPRQSVPPP